MPSSVRSSMSFSRFLPLAFHFSCKVDLSLQFPLIINCSRTRREIISPLLCFSLAAATSEISDRVFAVLVLHLSYCCLEVSWAECWELRDSLFLLMAVSLGGWIFWPRTLLDGSPSKEILRSKAILKKASQRAAIWGISVSTDLFLRQSLSTTSRCLRTANLEAEEICG